MVEKYDGLSKGQQKEAKRRAKREAKKQARQEARSSIAPYMPVVSQDKTERRVSLLLIPHGRSTEQECLESIADVYATALNHLGLDWQFTPRHSWPRGNSEVSTIGYRIATEADRAKGSSSPIAEAFVQNESQERGRKITRRYRYVMNRDGSVEMTYFDDDPEGVNREIPTNMNPPTAARDILAKDLGVALMESWLIHHRTGPRR